jgi:AcrR family transcriptional regulator
MAKTTAEGPRTGGRRRRADAERNIQAILDAAVACLSRNPDASVADIALTAGVGRVTLYGHFSSRAILVDAVMARTVAQADATLQATGLDEIPADEALTRMVTSAWPVLNQYRAVLIAAERELPAERIRRHHDRPLGRVRRLIERGRREGVFRTDLPVGWLVTMFHTVLHSAAQEVITGRLTLRSADRVIVDTLLAAYTPPGQPVPVGALSPASRGRSRTGRQSGT